MPAHSSLGFEAAALLSLKVVEDVFFPLAEGAVGLSVDAEDGFELMRLS